jgi:hypothetical protein
MGVGGQCHPPGRFTPEQDQIPIVEEAGRASVDGCAKYRPAPGFDPRTIQPVASRYTD